MKEAETLHQVQADYVKAKEATAAAKNSADEARAASSMVPVPAPTASSNLSCIKTDLRETIFNC